MPLWQFVRTFCGIFLRATPQQANIPTISSVPPTPPSWHTHTILQPSPSLDPSPILFLQIKRCSLFLSQKEYGQSHVTLSFLGPGEFMTWSWLLMKYMFQTWSYSELWMAAKLLDVSQGLCSPEPYWVILSFYCTLKLAIISRTSLRFCCSVQFLA